MSATFPLLDIRDICAVFKDIGAPAVTADALQTPTPSIVLPLYAWFLEALGQLTLDDVMVTAQLQLDTYDNQEVYREVVYTGTLHAVLDQIMKWAALDDFSPLDIRAPTRQRMQRVFSALINFYLYEQDQVGVLDELEKDAEKLAKDEHDVDRKHAELQDAVDKKREELATRSKAANKLEGENATSREELIRKKDTTGTLTKVIESDRKEKTRLHEEMEVVLNAVNESEAEITKLRGRIVRSPERVRVNVRSLEDRIGQLKTAIADLERKKQDHEDRISVLRKYDPDIAALIRAVDDWETELERAEEESERLLRQREERDARKEELADLDFRSSTIEKRLTNLREQKQRQAASALEKKEGVRRRMQRVEEAHKTVMKEQAVADEEASRRQKAIQAKEKEIAELAKEAQAELTRGEAAYLELKAEVESYVTKLERTLDGLNSYNALS